MRCVAVVEKVLREKFWDMEILDTLSRRRKSVIAPAPPAERGNGGCAGQAAVRAMMAPWMRRIVRPLRGPVRSGHSHERLKTHHVIQ